MGGAPSTRGVWLTATVSRGNHRRRIMPTDVDQENEEPKPPVGDDGGDAPTPGDDGGDPRPPQRAAAEEPAFDEVYENLPALTRPWCMPRRETKLDRSPDVSRLSRHSYMAGLAGMLALLGGGYLAARRGMMDHGWGIGSGEFDINRSMALVLVVCSAVMFLVELAIRFDVDRGRLVKIAPEVKRGDYGPFLGRCLLIYAIELGLISLFFFFYKTASEYGFRNNPMGYYRPWYAVMDTLRDIYLYGGLPYVILTRALQHAPKSDRKQAAFTVMKIGRRLYTYLTRGDLDEVPSFDRYDKIALSGLFVKAFYVPLMTVFFVDQFTHLIKNFSWMIGPSFELAKVNLRDVHNVSHSFIFAVDVGLAWCGYVVSSRWIKNTLFSVEPTWLGWFVAIACYPPHNRLLGVYYGTPGEDAFFAIPNPRVVTFFAILSILSFCVYTSATVVFGLRFSNLTHRGVITTGPYAFVRHPAYASKNFSWWCVMLPFALYQIYTQRSWEPMLQVAGMVLMSLVYYFRAVTEERHLARDPEYRKYMEKVPYRFIPGVL